MASRKQTYTAGTTFTGTQYTEMLEKRLQAMHQFEAGTIDQATKNAARAVVRQARRQITSAGMEVGEWREAEAKREDAAKVARTTKRAQAKAEVSQPE